MEEFYDGEERVYNLGDENPKFKGGQAAMFKFIGQNFIIPKEYRENGPGGTRTVYIGFVVEKDGCITNVRVRRGISGLDEESMRVIKLMSGHWDAGSFEGQKVRMAYTLPIKTHLE
jgi:protein TonB